MRRVFPNSIIRSLMVFCCLALSARMAFAAEDPTFRLGRPFGDHMVLQREAPVPVWGEAAPGASVSVVFANQHEITQADADGKWAIKLKAMPASSEPRQMRVSATGGVKLDIEDILVGEVWLCSGQSNMQFPLASSEKSQEHLLQTNIPNIRLLNLQPSIPWSNKAYGEEELAHLTPEAYFIGSWARATPETAKDFSAVGWLFGKRLFEELDIPIGLIANAIGGSPAEAWTPRDVLRANPSAGKVLDSLWIENESYNLWCREQGMMHLKPYLDDLKAARAEGRPLPEPPHHPFEPSFLYDSGIAPLLPYAIRGAIWYQGEGNANNARDYRVLFPLMIQTWRERWGQGDFPFYFVQLANYMKPPSRPSPSQWADLREAQAQTLRLPNTGMAVTIDIGDEKDIHPKNKADVGERLARWALVKDYGRTNLVYSGPLYKSMKIEGSQIRVSFDFIGSGLMHKSEAVNGFEIVGADGTEKWADARIEGDSVVVWNDEITSPVAVRYAWADNPDGSSLYNMEGLPASPFRTYSGPISPGAMGQEIAPGLVKREFIYKSIGEVNLTMHLYEPALREPGETLPAAVFFFGGGWTSGSPSQFFPFCEYLASRGMVAVSAEYRIKSKHGTTPFECVQDGKSAVRYLRTHAADLRIDPERIVAGGGSAGGHVGVCTGVLNTWDDPADDISISSRPNAMVLFNPVLDTTKLGYGSSRFKPDMVKEISPAHHVKAGIAPTIIFHGKADTTVPYENAVRFRDLMREKGNVCELVSFDGKKHGFFNFGREKADYTRCLIEMDSFLKRLGYLEGKETVGAHIKRIWGESK